MTNRSIKKDYPKRSPMNSKEVQFYFPCPFCQAIPFTGMALISKKKTSNYRSLYARCRNPHCNLLTFGEGLRNYFDQARVQAQIKPMAWDREEIRQWIDGCPINKEGMLKDE